MVLKINKTAASTYSLSCGNTKASIDSIGPRKLTHSSCQIDSGSAHTPQAQSMNFTTIVMQYPWSSIRAGCVCIGLVNGLLAVLVR